MYLQSISSAFPEQSYSQAECWQHIQDSPTASALRGRSLTILDRVLNGDSGIDKRHLCIEDPVKVWSLSAGELNRAFERFAPEISARALQGALEKAGLGPAEIDALFICTCTGYICPGITSYLAEKLGMREDTYLQDLVGLGCGAAIPTLRSAEGFLAANPGATVAVIAVEICSAAFYIDDEPGVLISLCLFGDGASASIWKSTPPQGGPAYKAGNFRTSHRPESREKIRFVNANGKLKNKLHRSVPEVAAEAVKDLFDSYDYGENLPHILAHPGGRDVIEALEATLPVDRLPESREVLRQYGNLSSPSVLVALEHHLTGENPRDHLWLTSFGAGFACHSVELVRN